ncbi:MAG: hypothetical protein K6F86_11570, partial [Lachnospiraceae bacterium]|nr:hypothetical protein [Lachnospiraceae bacterium]
SDRKTMRTEKRVCICVPTENRDHMIAEVLEYEKSYYPQFDIDIVYFDSGRDLKTEEVIKKYRGSGFDNLYHKRTPRDYCIDRKIVYIWENEEFLKDYKYIWLINDSISVTKEALTEILSYLDEDYDLIRLPVAGAGEPDDHETTDPDDWFAHCSKGMAHMASTIMSTRLLKGEIDWDGLYEKYVGTDDIHAKGHGFFFTVGFYLERIAGLSADGGFKGILIGNRIKWRRDCPLKKGRSYWDELIFETWARSYPETIMKIPESYTGKEEVIRTSDNILFGRFERQSLISLRIRGLFSEKECEKYKRFWPLVSTLSYEELLTIARTPVEVLKSEYGENYGRIDRWEENLEAIEKSIGDREIIVYGAGLYGEYVVKKLIDDGYDRQIAGIAVSDASKNVAEIFEKKVKNIDDYDEDKNRVIIVSALPDTAAEITRSLRNKGFTDIVQLF